MHACMYCVASTLSTVQPMMDSIKVLLFVIVYALLQCSSGLAPSVEIGDRFKTWLINGGGQVHKNIDISISEMGYGLKAKGIIRADEIIVSVPKTLCFESIGGSNEEKLNQIAFALCTERAKGDDSLYRPFLDTLPDDVSYIPALWSDSRLNKIKGTNIHSDCVKMRSSWENTFNTFNNKVNVDITDYLWGRGTLQGRILSFETSKSFNKVKNNDNVIYSLTPFISLPNHSDDSELYPSLSYGNTEYLLRADKNIFANNDLFITYGTMSFQQRILCFGWVDREVSASKYSITTITVPGATDNIAEEIEIKTLIYHDPVNPQHQKLLNKELMGVLDRIKVITQNNSATKAVELIVTQISSKITSLNPQITKLDVNLTDEEYIIGVECIAAQNILEYVTKM